MRPLLLCSALTSWSLLAVPAHGAPAESAPCVGWAVPGALAGALAGVVVSRGALTAAGDDPSASPMRTRDAWIVGSSMLVGLSAGPLASCALAGREGHRIPAASFVLAGASIGAPASGGGAWALSNPHGDANVVRGAVDSRAEGRSTLAILAGALGAMAGGIGGYALHRAIFGDPPPANGTARVGPWGGRDGAGLSLHGVF